MPTLLFRSPSDPPERWRTALQEAMPELEVRVWPDHGRLDEIDYALVWASPDGFLHDLPNLRAVFSLGAGVDHLVDGEIPPGVPLVRMVDPALTEGMIEYVTHYVLRHHRGFDRYAARQRTGAWEPHEQVRPGQRRVGILGLGELGGNCARTLARLGFDVRGLARTAREMEGVKVYTGSDGLRALLAESDILVCLLPLTAATRGILGGENLYHLPGHAVVINAARGAHVVDEDLLCALGEGHIDHAVLDAFDPEPLPPAHPFWTHPHVTVTPHIASLTNPETGAAHVVEGIRREMAGDAIPYTVDPERGY